MILKEIDETFSEEELDGIMSDVSFSIIDIILTIMFITIMVRTENTILSKIRNLIEQNFFPDWFRGGWLRWICENNGLNKVIEIHKRQNVKYTIFHL